MAPREKGVMGVTRVGMSLQEDSRFMTMPLGVVAKIRDTTIEAEVEDETDTMVGACLREFKNMLAHKNVSKGLSWNWQINPPSLQALLPNI